MSYKYLAVNIKFLTFIIFHFLKILFTSFFENLHQHNILATSKQNLFIIYLTKQKCSRILTYSCLKYFNVEYIFLLHKCSYLVYLWYRRLNLIGQISKTIKSIIKWQCKK